MHFMWARICAHSPESESLKICTWCSCRFVRAINIHPDAGGFVIGAGAILGITAAFLWTAQGSLMLSYPTEAQKGIFISIFWGIFNLGAVVGSSVSFGQNFHSTVRLFAFKVKLLTSSANDF